MCRLQGSSYKYPPSPPSSEERIEDLKSFEVKGVDYTDVISITNADNREQHTYIVLFTYATYQSIHLCATSQSIHLELVTNLPTDTFLAGQANQNLPHHHQVNFNGDSII